MIKLYAFLQIYGDLPDTQKAVLDRHTIWYVLTQAFSHETSTKSQDTNRIHHLQCLSILAHPHEIHSSDVFHCGLV